MNLIDTKRHADYLRSILLTFLYHIIGVGGVGSHVVELLARMQLGMAGMFLYDGDTVEAHNPPNQQFTRNHIGQKKVLALKDQVKVWSDGNVPVHASPEYVTAQIDCADVVFLCLDSMQARKDIMQASIFGNPKVSVVIETRMDAGIAEVFMFNPNNTAHVTIWESLWFPDSAAENMTGCNGHVAIPTAVAMTASLAVQLLLNYYRDETKNHPNHVRLNLETWKLSHQQWPTVLDE